MRRFCFLLVAAALAAPVGARAAGPLQQISTDPFRNPDSQHATEVEPDSFAFGDTVVAVFQAGRFHNGGASGIGFATSRDRGRTWTAGTLPWLTVHSSPPGVFDRASDPTIAYDAAHRVWLAATLAIEERTTGRRVSVWVSRSADGTTWGAPVPVVRPETLGQPDKSWIVCDNGSSSPYRGRCYISYSDWLADAETIVTMTSADGGLTWQGPVTSRDPAAAGVGTQPLVQPNGTLVVSFLAKANDRMLAIRSTDGARTFGDAITIDEVRSRPPTAMRALPLPSAEIDADGRIFIAWHDCRFRPGCSGVAGGPNDIVFSSSTDGVNWAGAVRIPLADAAGAADHFIPGLGVDPQSAGSAAAIGVAYYGFADGGCTFSTCRLEAGFVASPDGGRTWSTPIALSETPMALDWIADTTLGRMVGDYISTTVTARVAVPVLALAGPFDGMFHEAIFAGTIAVPSPLQGGSPPQPIPPPPPSGIPPPPAGTTHAVTLDASRRTVVYGQNVVLSGAVSSAGAGELVELPGVAAVRTGVGGVWRRVVTPRVSREYRARWRTATSAPVAIGVRPAIRTAYRRGALIIRVVAARSFAGRRVVVERRASGSWRRVATARLRRGSRATVRPRLPHGRSVVRVVLPAREAGRGYLAGASRPLTVRR